MIDIEKIKYPHLERIMNLKPNPSILLGQRIYWTVKRDGSNLGAYIDNEGNLQLRSRNMLTASLDFYAAFRQVAHCNAVKEMILNARDYGDDYVVFGELLLKGLSPTRIEKHENHDFIVFDIWSEKEQRFLNYNKVYQECYHFDIPVVELWGTCKLSKLDDIFDFRDTMIERAKEESKEGVVGKVWAKLPWNSGKDAGVGRDIIYFKEKQDLPDLRRIPNKEDNGKIVLPVLPDSEIYGAVDKAYVDLGEDFKEIRKAMPLIAQYVNKECRNHNCSAPRNLLQYYKQRLQDIEVGNNEVN